MEFVFYGTRGSVSVRGPEYDIFGGVTTCCALRTGDKALLIDCGSGTIALPKEIFQQEILHVLITHPHNDHIGGVMSLLMHFRGKELHFWGRTRDGLTVKEQINRLMGPPFWPVTADIFPFTRFHELPREPFELDGVTIGSMESNHPGGCLCYRFETAEGCVVTAFDFNHADGAGERLTEFAHGCNLLVYDGSMSDEEYARHASWGHSTAAAGAEIARKSGAKKLALTHHNFRATDAELLTEEAEIQKGCPFAFLARDGQCCVISDTEDQK